MEPDDTVCQCNGVSKGRICDAIADGCTSLEDVSRATRASTGCGDCKPLVRELIEKEGAAKPAPEKVPALAGAGEKA